MSEMELFEIDPPERPWNTVPIDTQEPLTDNHLMTCGAVGLVAVVIIFVLLLTIVAKFSNWMGRI